MKQDTFTLLDCADNVSLLALTVYWKFWCLPETRTATASTRNQFEQNQVTSILITVLSFFQDINVLVMTQNVYQASTVIRTELLRAIDFC